MSVSDDVAKVVGYHPLSGEKAAAAGLYTCMTVSSILWPQESLGPTAAKKAVKKIANHK